MIETEYPLQTSGSVTLDASGNGTLRFQPARANERWKVTLFSLNTTARGGNFRIYRGEKNIGRQVDYTNIVEGNVSTADIELRNGDYLTASWEGCAPGAIGTLRIEGQMFVKGMR